MPPHLRDGHYKGAAKLGHGRATSIRTTCPGGIAAQQYAPDEIHGKRYYEPTRYGAEARYAEVVERVRERLRGRSSPPAEEQLSPSSPYGGALSTPASRPYSARGVEEQIRMARRSSATSPTGSGNSKRTSKYP